MRLMHTFVVMFAMLLMPAGALLAQTQLPTMEDIQSDYDAGNFQDAIRKIVQVVNLRTAAAANYDKGKLLNMKAEAHLKLNQSRPAQDAFAAAAKEMTDEKDIAMNSAMSTLVQKSTGFNYRPKNPLPGEARGSRPEPIGIMEPESRKLALTALFNDELKASAARIRSLQQQKTLPPIMAGVNQMQDLRYIELAATGADIEFQNAMGDLGDHAAQLMTDAMDGMDTEVSRVRTNANKSSPVLETLPGGQQRQVNNKAGLTSADVTLLQNTIATTVKIKDACDQFTKVIPASAGALAKASAQADKLAAKADQVLKADYSPAVSDVITAPNTRVRRGAN